MLHRRKKKNSVARPGYARLARAALRVGIGLTALGMTALIAALALPGVEAPSAHQIARTSLVIGVILGGFATLALKGRSIEEAYTLGYDLGYEKGVRAALGDFTESVTAAVEEEQGAEG